MYLWRQLTCSRPTCIKDGNLHRRYFDFSSRQFSLQIFFSFSASRQSNRQRCTRGIPDVSSRAKLPQRVLQAFNCQQGFLWQLRWAFTSKLPRWRYQQWRFVTTAHELHVHQCDMTRSECINIFWLADSVSSWANWKKLALHNTVDDFQKLFASFDIWW